MPDKPPPHPPRQAKHPGRGKLAPHKRASFQQEEHAKAMKRPNEEFQITRHSLQGHPHNGK